jgi:hypothetical protein
VDRHVRKGRQPVDDGRETARGLWTPARARPAGPATLAVENRSAHVDDRAADYLRNPARGPSRERRRMTAGAAVTFPERGERSFWSVTEADGDRRPVPGGDGRRFRLASPRTALVLGALFAVLAVALVPLSLTARQNPLVNGGEALGTIPFAAVGVFIARRQPRNPIGWLFFGIAACLLLSIDSGFYSVINYRLGQHLPLAPVALFLYELWGPGLLLFALVILLFPDGRPTRS